jgi:hypothetical protein
VIAATAHRLVETIIIAILVAPVAAFLIVYIVAWRMGALEGDRELETRSRPGPVFGDDP